MHIRTAGAEEMLALWGEDPAHPSPTARFNCENIRRGSATLFVWDRGGALAGELYLFRSLSDPDFADGKKRAYLCALRVREDLRGRGLGTALMEHVIAQAAQEGFSALTIGVEYSEEANIRLYRRLGFTELVKDCVLDPCSMDEHMDPEAHTGFHLLLKRLCAPSGKGAPGTGLTAMRNIGRELERKLRSVGVDSAEKLAETGSKQAFSLLKQRYPGVCLVHLYALEGAVTDTDYNRLSEEKKRELKEFCDLWKK
ncbi:MAG: GNAT family N-acetyltransferase [Oscillospiraceae bacterium]|nr:GNAT family N-acetyltransferase [Oscillospiraceae bacterium]MCI9392122.1 GNAT family N-acetyltransferase [Oscillospiraceae bacterium]